MDDTSRLCRGWGAAGMILPRLELAHERQQGYALTEQEIRTAVRLGAYPASASNTLAVIYAEGGNLAAARSIWIDLAHHASTAEVARSLTSRFPNFFEVMEAFPEDWRTNACCRFFEVFQRPSQRKHVRVVQLSGRYVRSDRKGAQGSCLFPKCLTRCSGTSAAMRSLNREATSHIEVDASMETRADAERKDPEYVF